MINIVEEILDSLDIECCGDEDYRHPCWEIKVDRDIGDMVFLIDAKEMYRHPLSKIDPSYLTLEGLIAYMHLFKTNLKSLIGVLNNGHKQMP